jgi:hypothetical protein
MERDMDQQTTRERFDVTEARAVLSRTPRVLHTLFEGLPAGWLNAREAPDAWTPTQILGHLVEAERGLWIPRARSILERGEDAAFPAFDRDAHLTLHAHRSADELLALFDEGRQQSLAELDSLDLGGDALDRKGRHPEFGPVTLGQLLSTWVVHDLAHSRQIFRSMAKRYREAIGPWRHYLRVMDE